MLRIPALLALALACAPARAVPAAGFQGSGEEEARVRAWTARLAQPRQVLDRAVICFDEGAYLREIAKWDRSHFWPVLLWDSALVPAFLEAFRPAQVLLAREGPEGRVSIEAALGAIAAAWEMAHEKRAPAEFLAALSARERAPLGAVLLGADSPELLGGLALAAGRFHLPLVMSSAEHHDERIAKARVEVLREELRARLGALGVAFEKKFDELDFVTLANDLPFGYTIEDGTSHPGGYTLDDALARNDDLTRWGWVGRLVGGPQRSIYMAMCALFLQPRKGLFFSRYNPKSRAFGAFDPAPALETFSRLFPTSAIRHPEATLKRWRELMWPGGNRFGFLYVNSSGGATSWSTSKGGATHFDVPPTIPAIVHYTHSGSAGRPFDADTIAGRWLSGGAYIYFGSYSEPYLQAFVPPVVLAKRVALGIPLGAAMRLGYRAENAGARSMKVGGEQRVVRFNMSGPWKLAYFGDPSYQLTGVRAERQPPGEAGSGYYKSVAAFRRARLKGAAARARHARQSIGVVLLDRRARRLVDDRLWGRILKALPAGADPAPLQLEMLRVWIAALRRLAPEKIYSKGEIRKLHRRPKTIEELGRRGAASPAAARLAADFAKSYLAGLDAHPQSDAGRDRTLARWALELACSFAHPPGSRKQFYAWVNQACSAIGVKPEELRAMVLKLKWIPPAARKDAQARIK